ncbi:MAG: hypothetical protein Q8L47_03755 [bacterium]|nr:hypothetical protein [bacterium]
MPRLPTFPSFSLGDAMAFIYRIYPYRLQKVSRLLYDAEGQSIKDFENAEKKIILICRTFVCNWHPDIDVIWFNNTINLLNNKKVTIVIVSEEDPPKDIRELITSGKITFKKSNQLPFVGHIIDNKIIDISFDKRFSGLTPGGNYWRTEQAMPDIIEMLEDAVNSSIA